ncbi:unnamed protein product [Paramecium sonneborni]|uniref:WD-40 repeat protein n=1 Tax=Paramecium sonneborni TaxID=65129 RepID=A0A8S1QWU0_9CILI|nr:unnamed protein product [Paramecium sonneborni]
MFYENEMKCQRHLQNLITSICVDRECKFQRKLCARCLDLDVHGANNTVSIDKFKEMANKKLEIFKQTSNELANSRAAFKQKISQAQIMLKTFLDDSSEQIKQLFDRFDQENQSYINLITKIVQNPAESQQTDLEKLVSIIIEEERQIKDQNIQKICDLKVLDEIKNEWENGIKTVFQNSNELLYKIKQIQLVEGEVYQKEKDLFKILASDIDEQILKKVIDQQGNDNISNILTFFSKLSDINLYASFVNEQVTIQDIKQKIKNIMNALRNILDHPFSQINYSEESYEEERFNLIKKISGNKMIVNFLKCLVQLTNIDEKFIQCGSNGLNLLAQMKVDLTNDNFQGIRIKNTSLIGGNFVRCNFSKSKFEDVDLTGVNLNGALLLKCEWKNIKIQELNKLDGHSNWIQSVCFSPDKTTLASGSGDKSIRLWDVKTGQQKAKIDGHSDRVWSVCFSPDGTTLASGSDDKSIRLWDVKTGQQKAKLDGHSNTVYSVSFSPDNTTLASGSSDMSVRLWDVKTGQQKAKLDGHSNTVYSVSFSPDNTTLASGSSDMSVRVWNVKTGQQEAKLDGHNSYVQSVCFSPDGTILASGGYDKSIRLWNVKTGQQKAKLDGHSQWVQSVCFSPDRTTLASGSQDNSIRIWDAQTGQQKAKLDGHNNWVQSVCFSSDGTILASGSYDNSIRIWDLEIGQQIYPTDKRFKDLIEDLKIQLPKTDLNYPKLIISSEPTLYVQGAVILGEFVNHQDYDLKPILKQQGCYIFGN